MEKFVLVYFLLGFRYKSIYYRIPLACAIFFNLHRVATKKTNKAVITGNSSEIDQNFSLSNCILDWNNMIKHAHNLGWEEFWWKTNNS